MTKHPNIFLCIITISLLVINFLRADENDLSYPAFPDEKLFDSLKEASPFLRTLNISETYALRAVASFSDIGYARVYNKETKKTITVELGGEAQSGIQLLKIIEPRESNNLTAVAARISFAGEVAELKYDPVQLDASRRSSGPPSGKGGPRGGPPKGKGPSPEERQKYHSLSDDQKKKFHEYIKATVKKYPDMPREERGNLIRGALQKLSDGRGLDIPK